MPARLSRTPISVVSSLALIVTLSACGGSSTGPTSLSTQEADNLSLSFVEAVATSNDQATADDLVERLGDPNASVGNEELDAVTAFGRPRIAALFNNDEFTQPNTLPTTGTAGYVGGMVIRPDETITTTAGDEFTSIGAQGALAATVDFNDNSISGTAHNFHRLDNDQRLVGTLALVAQIDRIADVSTEFGISGGSVIGTLSQGDENTIFTYTTLDGHFLGSDGSVFQGNASGGVNFTDGLPLVGSIEFGGFAVE